MASRGKGNASSSSSRTGLRSFFCGLSRPVTRGTHIQQTDDDEQFDMSQYDLGLDDQLSDDDVEEVEPMAAGNVGGGDGSEQTPTSHQAELPP